MAKHITISAEQLSKCYRVFSSPRARLAQGLWRKRFSTLLGPQGCELRVGSGANHGRGRPQRLREGTLLQLLCRTLTPSGTMEIEGRVAALLELGSGFNPEFTGIENIYLNAALLV